MGPRTAASPAADRRLRLLVALGAWAAIVPYLATLGGLDLEVTGLVEVVDHVLPGALAVGLAVVAARTTAARREIAVAGCVLCGLFVTVSHVPLLAEGGGAGRPWSAVLLHNSAGLPLLLAALAVLLVPARASR